MICHFSQVDEDLRKQLLGFSGLNRILTVCFDVALETSMCYVPLQLFLAGHDVLHEEL